MGGSTELARASILVFLVSSSPNGWIQGEESSDCSAIHLLDRLQLVLPFVTLHSPPFPPSVLGVHSEKAGKGEGKSGVTGRETSPNTQTSKETEREKDFSSPAVRHFSHNFFDFLPTFLRQTVCHFTATILGFEVLIFPSPEQDERIQFRAFHSTGTL